MKDYSEKIIEFKSYPISERFDYLVRYWKVEESVKNNNTIQLVGKFSKSKTKDKNGNDYGYFVNIRNLNGDILYYPFGLGEVQVWAPFRPILQQSEFWLIKLTIDDSDYSENNPCALRLADFTFGQPKNKFNDKIEKEKLIRKIFKETGYTKTDAKNEANALRSIMGDLYTETERFIFELLQNADDQPNENKKVKTSLRLLQGNLIFTHNGKPFDKDDVVSICSIGDSTKKNDSDKIGYKGIGFKSVFSDSNTVYINSGNFSFSFDKESFLYNKEENMDEVPWQIKPIWAEMYRYPKSVREDNCFFKSPVGIALSIPSKKIDEYAEIIPQLLNEPRFVLFLKNIYQLSYCDIYGKEYTIQKTINENVCEISSNDEIKSSWITQDFVIDVPEETKDLIQDDKLVPRKLKEANKTKISFAIIFKDNKIVKVKKEQSILFTYLPTKVKDFEFPFLVNADFLTTASRESIHYKNLWNRFLFSCIGEKLVDWAIMLSENVSNYLEVLPKQLLSTEDETKKILAICFNESYIKALKEKSFILNSKGYLSPQNEIVVDKSGLTEIIDEDTFYKFIGNERHLPNDAIKDIIIKYTKIFEYITIWETKDLLTILVEKKEEVNSWYKKADEEKRNAFIKWVKENLENPKEIINNLPVFKYEDNWYNKEEIDGLDSIIILSNKLLGSKAILQKLGFEFTENVVDDLPINNDITLNSDKELYDRITTKDFAKLTFEERKSLFILFQGFDDIKEQNLKECDLFFSQNKELKSLSEMKKYDDKAPEWLYPYMISEDENDVILKDYLISDDDVFQNIIIDNIDDILQTTDILSVYNIFKENWTNVFSNTLFRKEIPQTDIIKLVEQLDDETKKDYLRNCSNIKLSPSLVYDENSYEYKVLQLAVNTLEEPYRFANKVYYDNHCIKEFTLKDEISLEYEEDGNKRIAKMQLSKLLPEYSSESTKIDRVKKCFKKSKGLDKLFEPYEKQPSEIYRELADKLSFPPREFPEWNCYSSNVYQYLYVVYYRKRYRNWFSVFIPKLNLEYKSQEYISELMDFLYNNDIKEGNLLFLYHLQSYFKAHYFSSKYILDREKVLQEIELWADQEKKKTYLKKLGVLDESSPSILLRKKFLNNEEIEIEEDTNKNDIISCLSYLTENSNIIKPFIGDNQVTFLKECIPFVNKSISSDTNIKELINNSEEWNSVEYKTWIEGHYPRIYISSILVPKQYKYNNEVLWKEYDGNIYYDKDNKNLYIYHNDIEGNLFNAVSEVSVFEIDDYDALCRSGKVLISKDELDNTIEENNRLKRIIREIEEVVPEKKQVVERGLLGKYEQKSINKEVRLEVKEYLEAHGYDVESWDPLDSISDVIQEIKNPKGESINVIIRSAEGSKLHLSASSFESLMSSPNNLLVVKCDDGKIHTIDFEELFGNNSNVNLIFDANFTPREYFYALATIFKYVKNTDFVIANPNYSAFNEIKGFGLDVKNEGNLVKVEEEDI